MSFTITTSVEIDVDRLAAEIASRLLLHYPPSRRWFRQPPPTPAPAGSPPVFAVGQANAAKAATGFTIRAFFGSAGEAKRVLPTSWPQFPAIVKIEGGEGFLDYRWRKNRLCWDRWDRRLPNRPWTPQEDDYVLDRIWGCRNHAMFDARCERLERDLGRRGTGRASQPPIQQRLRRLLITDLRYVPSGAPRRTRTGPATWDEQWMFHQIYESTAKDRTERLTPEEIALLMNRPLAWVKNYIAARQRPTLGL